MSTPVIRVSAATDTLDFLEKQEVGGRARVLDTIPAEAREVILGSPRSSWLSIEHDHFVVDGIVKVHGVRGGIALWRKSIPALVDKPLLKSFTSGMIRMFGNQSARLLSIIPKGWPLVYRDFCVPELGDQTDTSCTLHFERVHDAVWRYPNYFHCWRAVCEGITDLAQLDATSELELSRVRQAAAVHLSWTRKP